MIPGAVIERIRAEIDPVDVIGRRIELRKAGTSFSGRCPFHADRTPSFRVYPDSKRFKCFGCGARGDTFEFVRRFDGKDFRTVVRELAGEAGVGVVDEGPPAEAVGAGDRVAVARACEVALEHWAERLWGPAGADARRYLISRGVQEPTIRQFRLGWAPREWHDLENALRARGFSQDELLRAGLVRESTKEERRVHDRFRGRIVFPFLQLDGRVAGFGARILPGVGEGPHDPKYVNSPETPTFRKGQLLFGIHEAHGAMRKARRAVLVEGYLDALALSQAGVKEVVAAGGTSLTEQQAAQLQRWGAEELIVLFDTDAAGLDAPAQIAPALLRAGVTTRVARLPGAGVDPDAFVAAHGSRGLALVLDAAVPLTEWLLERAIAARMRGGGARAISVEQKLQIVRDLRPFVQEMPAGLPRALFEQRIARRLELYIVALRAELGRGIVPRAKVGGAAPWRR
jgi:DNA primase